MGIRLMIIELRKSAGHLAGRPGTLGSQSCFFQSIFILLNANASLIAPQWSYKYLFPFPTWRPIVCIPVPCSHPHLFHPHAESHISYRYSPVPVLIVCVPSTLWLYSL